MNLADVFTVVLVIVGLLAVFVGWWLTMAGLFPRTIERCADQLGAAPFKCWFAGLVCVVPLIAAASVLGKVSTNAPGKLLSAALVVATILAALAGTAGLALRIGRGLPTARDGGEPWRRVLRGGLVLALTYLSIVLVPVTLLAGFGALVMAAVGKKEAVATVSS